MEDVVLAPDVRYSPKEGYIMLHVAALSLPALIQLQGKTFERKQEFHCSLLNARRLAAEYEPSEARFVEATQRLLAVNPVTFTSEFFHCKKEDRQSIIVLVEVKQLHELYKGLRRQLNLPQLPDPMPHVTLYKYNTPFGIGIPSQADFANYCQPLEESVVKELVMS